MLTAYYQLTGCLDSTEEFELLLVTLDVVDEAIGTGVMSSSWFVLSQLWLDDLCKSLAQLNTGEK